MCVCLFEIVNVCQREYLRNYTSNYHRSCACYLRPWLDPPLTALRYIMYFRFMDDVMARNWPEACLYRCSEWRHCVVVVRRLTPLLCCIGCVVWLFISAMVGPTTNLSQTLALYMWVFTYPANFIKTSDIWRNIYNSLNSKVQFLKWSCSCTLNTGTHE